MSASTSEHAPHSNDTTSKDAAQSIAPHLSKLEAKVWSVFTLGPRTADFVAGFLGMRTQTVTARIRALVQAGMLKDSGMRGRTTSGRTAILWVKGDGVRSLSASRSHFDRGVREERARMLRVLDAFRANELITEDAWTALKEAVDTTNELR